MAAAVLIGAVAVAFLARSLADNWSQVRTAVADANLALLALGFGLAAAAMADLGRLWGRSLALLGRTLPPGRVVTWWFVGELGKYVPGGILSVVGRAEVARRGGAGLTASYGSVPLSLALRYFAAVLTFAVLLPFDLTDQLSAATVVAVALVPVGLAALHPGVVGRLLAVGRRVTGRPLDLPVPSWERAVVEVLAYVPNWLLIVGSTYCAARAFSPDVDLLPLALATLLSWTVGFVAFPLPAGAGLREAVFVAASGLPAGVAAAVAITSRLLFMAVDGLGAAACLPWLRRHHPTGAAEQGPRLDSRPGTGTVAP